MTWAPEVMYPTTNSHDQVTNGHSFSPNVPKTAQTVSKIVEEEDPYEKIEIKKNVEGKTMQLMETSVTEVEISSEVKETNKTEKETSVVMNMKDERESVKKDKNESSEKQSDIIDNKVSEVKENNKSITESIPRKQNKKSKSKNKNSGDVNLKTSQEKTKEEKNNEEIKSDIEISIQSENINMKSDDKRDSLKTGDESSEIGSAPKKFLPSSSNCNCIHDVSPQDLCNICDDHFKSIKEGFDNLKIQAVKVFPKGRQTDSYEKTNGKSEEQGSNVSENQNDIQKLSEVSNKSVEIEDGNNQKVEATNYNNDIKGASLSVKKRTKQKSKSPPQHTEEIFLTEIEAAEHTAKKPAEDTSETVTVEQNNITPMKMANQEDNDPTLKENKEIATESNEVVVGSELSEMKTEKDQKGSLKKNKGKQKDKARKKTQEFASSDLEAFRNEFAKKQGVKEVIIEPYNPVHTEENKNQESNEPTLEQNKQIGKELIDEKLVNQESLEEKAEPDKKGSFKENKSKQKDKTRKKTQEFASNDLDAFRNEFAKKQGVKEVIIEPFKPINTEKIKEDISIPYKGVPGDPEESKLMKEVKPDEDLYEPVGVDREEFVKNKLLQNNKDEELDLNGKAVNDNIIGFDVTNDGADSNNQQENNKTTMLIPPKLPERKKNSSKTSLDKDKESLSEKENVKVKEKKSSFIKDWQKDLKEFFSLRKKKPSTTSTLELPVEEYETETIGEIR